MKDNKRIIENHAKAIAKACKEYIKLFAKKYEFEGDLATSRAVYMSSHNIDRVIKTEYKDTLLGFNTYVIYHESGGKVLSRVVEASLDRAEGIARRIQEADGGRTYIAVVLETYGAEPEANEGECEDANE